MNDNFVTVNLLRLKFATRYLFIFYKESTFGKSISDMRTTPAGADLDLCRFAMRSCSIHRLLPSIFFLTSSCWAKLPLLSPLTGSLRDMVQAMYCRRKHTSSGASRTGVAVLTQLSRRHRRLLALVITLGRVSLQCCRHLTGEASSFHRLVQISSMLCPPTGGAVLGRGCFVAWPLSDP